MYQAGLVLEGGGMKGLYTAGVLDFFLDKEIDFSSVYGVSAGACAMVSYLSRQKGRQRDVMTDYLEDRHFMGLYSLLTTGDVFGVDMSYNLIPNYLNPFDYETFRKYEGNAYAVITNIETGEAEYPRLTDMENDLAYVRASSSLPLVSNNVMINGHAYLDGGIADSIPIRKSESDGNRKNVVVMTKPVGYKRAPEETLKLVKLKYYKYPKVYDLMKNRHNVYNETTEYIEKEAKNHNLFLIRPQENLEIGRIERNREKLLALYEEGYQDAQNMYDDLMAYLNS